MVSRLVSSTLTKVTKISGIALLMAFSAAVMTSQPSYANRQTFKCAMNQGQPATFVRTGDRREIPIIRWGNGNFYYSKLSPLQRCQQVSRRFQQNYDSGNLRTIISGTMNGYPVVCAAASTNDSCNSRTVLFTLKRGSNPRKAVEALLDQRGLASGRIQNQNGDNTQIYIDFDTFLENVQATR